MALSLSLSPASESPSPSPASRFHAGWRAISFSIVLLGFMGLAFTGEIHPVGIVIFLAVWLAGLASTRPPQWWSRWMSHVAVWTGLIPIGAMALHGDFASLLYLLMFLGLFKCLTLREPSDHLQAMLVAFFMLLATSIITTSATFLFLIFFFVALVSLELTSYNLARDLERANSPALLAQFRNGLLTAANRKGLLSLLARNSVMIGLVALTLAFGLFLLMPQYSARTDIHSPLARLRQPPPPERQSGYGEEVSFGVFDRLALDNTQVLTVKFESMRPAGPRPLAIHLRGTSLESYDEKRWTSQSETALYSSPDWRRVSLPVISSLSGPTVKQIINQRLTETGRLFGAGQPYMFEFDPKQPVQLQLNYRTGSLLRVIERAGWNQDFLPASFDYTVYSCLNDDASPLLRQLAELGVGEAGAPPAKTQPGAASAPPSQAEIAFDPGLRLDPATRAMYTAMPNTPLTQQISEISRRQANAPDSVGKMLQLIDWLQTDFEYSLTPETPRGMHPIEAFLTKTHKGHCEYFATAFCLLLRVQGIPTRLVTGFYTSEFNASLNRYIARQSDAHAWAEVWMDGLGWLTLDPTPPDVRGRNSAPSVAPKIGARMVNALQSFWQQYILYYSNSKQEQLYVAVLTSRTMRQLANFMERYSDLSGLGSLNKDWMSPDSGTHRVLLYMQYIALLIGFISLLVFYRFFRRKQQALRVTQSTIPFMNTLLKLQGLGWRRSPGQTPAELLREIDRQTSGKYDLGWVLDVYHRHRFAGQQPTTAELTRISETIHSIE